MKEFSTHKIYLLYKENIFKDPPLDDPVYHKPISLCQCYEWFSRFRLGDISLQKLLKCGQPNVVDNDALNDLMESDPKQIIENLDIAIGCGKTTFQDHIYQEVV